MPNQQFTRIRDLREDYDLSQADVANHLGLHLTTYRRWETGIHEVPAYIIRELAIFYNISSDYLLGLTNEPIPLPAKSKRQR